MVSNPAAKDALMGHGLTSTMWNEWKHVDRNLVLSDAAIMLELLMGHFSVIYNYHG